LSDPAPSDLHTTCNRNKNYFSSHLFLSSEEILDANRRVSRQYGKLNEVTYMMDVDALRAVQTSGPTTPSMCLLRAGPFINLGKKCEFVRKIQKNKYRRDTN